MAKRSKRFLLGIILVLFISLLSQAQLKGKTSPLDPAKKEKLKKEYLANLQKLGLKPEELKVISIGKSHIDAAWLWHWYQTRDEKCPKTFRNAIRHSELYPDFIYHQSSAQYYEWVQEVAPELFEEIKQAEKQGRWSIVGGMWVEPDGNMPEGESFVRQFLYGQRFFLKHFGKLAEVAWMEDSFGYNWNLPQIAVKSGAKYMYTAKPTWNGHNIFPFHLFYWQAPDGTKILTHISVTVGGSNYFPYVELMPMPYPDYFLSDLTKVDGNAREARFRETRLLLKPGFQLTANYQTSPQEIESALSQELMPVVGVFFGKGDGGFGPTTGEIKTQLALQELGYARLGNVQELFQAFERYGERIPVWNDELYFEFHQGVFTTHEWIKRANRQAEALMRTAEAIASTAFLLGAEYPREKLTQIWKLILLNQFHDILPGSSIPEVYEDAQKHYQAIEDQGNQLINLALNFLSPRIDTKSPQEGLEPIIVFNPLGWERADLVKYPVKGSANYRVFDQSGKELLSQTASSEEGIYSLYFQPSAVPAFGWKTFYVRAGERCQMPGPVVKETADKITIENDMIRIAIDKMTGLLTSLYDKRLQKEMLISSSNKIVAYKDEPKQYPAWNLAEDYLSKPLPVPEVSSVKIIDQGPIFARVLVERKGNPMSFKQWITVFKGSPLVEMITWGEKPWRDSITKIEFNTTINTDRVSAEIPYAVIERSTHPKVPWDQARTEMPMGKWVDLSTKDFGLSVLNLGKYAFSLTEEGMGLRISIIKNAKYPTSALEAREVNPIEKFIPKPETDPGEHWAHLALLSHPGDWKEAKIYQRAYEYNTPLVVYRASAHPGELSPEFSLFSLESPSAYLAQVKKAEEGNELVLRIVEAQGKECKATLKLNPSFQISSAFETDLLELNPKPLKLDKERALFLTLGPFEIKTIKLGLKKR